MAVLFFFYISWKKKKAKIIGDAILVQQLTSNYSPQKFAIKFCLFAVAFGLLVLALANPRRTVGSSNIKRNGIDVLFALDVSRSMLAQDIKPNRLERAKQLISKLIDKMPEDRFGIVVFAGKAYLQMPLTSDLAAAKMYLTSSGPDMVPTQGTVISDALKMCYAAFNTKEKKYKSIILISDGEDHDESAVQIAKSLAAEGVIVNTVGIGSPDGATIEDAVTGEIKKDAEGKIVVTKLNEEGLKSIADNTGGIYSLYINTDETANTIEKQLSSMERHGITETSLAAYQNYFPWLLGAALILLLVEFFMSERKKENASAENTNLLKATAFSVAFVFLSATTLAQTNTEFVKSGNELYNQKKYSEAADKYKKAIEKKPADATAQYNLGNALYKNNKKEDALKAYEQSLSFEKNNNEKAEAWYNKGVILQNDKKLPECIDAYKNALKLNPTDEEARLNLQKALVQQKQEQQQKENKQKKDDKKQQQKKQQPQQPKPQPSKMTKKEAEEKLKALLQQEKNLQDKLRKVNASSPEKPEKDW